MTTSRLAWRWTVSSCTLNPRALPRRLDFLTPWHSRAPRNASWTDFPLRDRRSPPVGKPEWSARSTVAIRFGPTVPISNWSASNCSVRPWWSGGNGILSAAIGFRWVAVGLQPPVPAARPPADRKRQTIVSLEVLTYHAIRPYRSNNHGSLLGSCLHPMEVKGWHFVGFSVAIEREAIGPAQDVDPHGSTEQLRPGRLRSPSILPPRIAAPKRLIIVSPM